MTRISCLAAALLIGACSSLAPVSPVAETKEAPPPLVSAAPVAVPAPSKAPPAPPKATQAPRAAAPAAKAAPPAPVVAAAPALDLKSLEQRLKGSSAIGVLTKLSLKNQVDDLVKRFRAYHDGSRPPQLADLRPSYELLLMKVLSLLQDKDTALAKEINASREAIWGLLADREKLARYA